MAQDWQAFPSGWSTGVNSVPRTLVDAPESIGAPQDATATANNNTNSMFALGKGMCTGLGVAAGSGDGAVNLTPKVERDLLAALGAKDDAPATDTGSNSAISFLKGILAQAGV